MRRLWPPAVFLLFLISGAFLPVLFGQKLTKASPARQASLLWHRFLRNTPLTGDPMLSREARRNVKLLFILGLFTLEGGTEIYVRLPQKLVYGSEPIYASNRERQQEDVVIIFPGLGGLDDHSRHLEDAVVTSDARQSFYKRYVEIYDWGQFKGSFLRASFDAQAVGRRVCSVLAEEQTTERGPIKHLHAVGMSVGAFAADSCIKTFNDISRQQHLSTRTQTRLTMLDPFTSKGVFGYGWGARQFGKGADLVESYVNTDDPVPTTNDPLPIAYNLDVTNSKLKRKFQPLEGDSMHSWPVEYLAQTWRTTVDSKGNLIIPTQEQEPKGIVVVAK